MSDGRGEGLGDQLRTQEIIGSSAQLEICYSNEEIGVVYEI